MQTIIQSIFSVMTAIEVYLTGPHNEIKPETLDAKEILCNKGRFPDLKLNRRSRNLFCGSDDAHLHLSGFALMVLLLESPDGIVSYDESCDEIHLKGRACPWRNRWETTKGSRRSAACRLSTILWLANIPYKITYSEAGGDVFILVPSPINSDSRGKIPISVVTTHRIFESGHLLEIKKSLKSLKTLVRLLQKYEYHELAGSCGKISPVLNKLPVVNSLQDL